jgi:hypothetical protein
LEGIVHGFKKIIVRKDKITGMEALCLYSFVFCENKEFSAGALRMTSRGASGIFRGRFGISYFQLEFSVGADAFWDVILGPPAVNSHFRFHGTVEGEGMKGRKIDG